jgi:hypothetical protein
LSKSGRRRRISLKIVVEETRLDTPPDFAVLKHIRPTTSHESGVVRLTLARLIDARIWIVARTAHVPHVPEQVSLPILHPQVTEVRADN